MDIVVTITDGQLDQLAQKLADKLLDVAPGLAFGDSAPLAPTEGESAPASPSTSVSSIPSTAPSTDSPAAADPAAEYRANVAQAPHQPASPVAQDAQGTAGAQGADLTPEAIAQAAADQFAKERQGLQDDQGDQAPTGPAVQDPHTGRMVHTDELTHPETPASPAPSSDEYTAP